MAQEEIKLIGSFKDDITPKLKKLTKQIDSIGRSFSKFNRSLRPISREFGRMAISANQFNESLRAQRSLLGANARAMNEYRKQSSKMAGAMRAMEAQRVKIARAQGVTRSEQRKSGGGMVPSVVRGGGGGKEAKAPRGILGRLNPFGKKGGEGFGAQIGSGFMGSIKTTAIGTSIGMMAGQALMGAVRGVGNLLAAPFKKFSSMFGERIKDEMDDIKSAGGLYALDMDLTQESGNERFFKNYNEALRMQEKLNIDMAQSAASLPGVTQQYVDVSRQLTDTIQMTMEKDREGFNKMAQAFGADVSMGGVDASKNAFQTVLKKQTEQLVLQSQGQTGGLPMHIAIQQLMSKEKGKIGMQAFTNKFRAAFQKNPLLKNFLMRAESELNKTEAGSAERLKLLMETFDAAMPKEVINKMRGSISGMMEALRSGFLDPQSGLFGMSRAAIDKATGQNLMKKNVDDFGNTLYKITEGSLRVDSKELQSKLEKLGIKKSMNETLNGVELTAEQIESLGIDLKVVGDEIKNKRGKAVGEVSKSTTYVFEQIREILAGYGPVLLEFVGFLPYLFDPFAQMTKSLMGFRDEAQAFISGFNKKLDAAEKKALSYLEMDDAESQGLGNLLKGQSRSRAAFSTVAETLKNLGGIDEELYNKVQNITGDASKSGIKAIEDGALTKIVPDLLKALWNSDLMKKFGRIGGLIVGGITKAVVDMIKNFTNILKGQGVNKLTEGFIAGFKEAFGDMSFNEVKSIIGDALVTIIAKGLDLIFKQVLPNLLHMYVGGLFKGLTSGSPVTMILSALGLKKLGGFIYDKVKGVMGMMGDKGLQGASHKTALALNNAAVAAQTFARAAGGKAAFGPQKTAAGTKGMMFGSAIKNALASFNKFFFGPIQGLTKGSSAAFKAIGGLQSGLKLGAVGGAIKAVLGMIQGKNPLDAISEGLASAGGSAIGAAIGTIIFPGIGTAIGAIIGGALGDIEPVVSLVKSTLVGLGEVLGAVFGPLGDIVGQVVGIMGDLVTGIFGLIPGLTGVNGEVDTMATVVNTIKIVLWPIVGLVQAIQMGLYALRLALVSVDLWATKTFTPWRSKRIAKLEDQKAKLSEEAAAAHKKNMEYYKPYSSAQQKATKATKEAAAAMAKLQDQAKKAGSTFENNKKFTGEDGKEYGWAIKDGEKILVEWGSVLGETTESARKFKEQMEINAKAKEIEESAGYQKIDKEVQDDLKMLREGYRKGADGQWTKGTQADSTAGDWEKSKDPGGASEAMDKIAPAADSASEGLDKAGASSENATKALESATTTIEGVPPKVEEALVGAATSAGQAITTAAQSLAEALKNAAQSIKNAASATASTKPDTGGNSYSGHMGGRGTKQLPLAEAIAKERSMMPSGADLMIANTSETVIPAFAGHMGEGFKGLSFAELESAAGFDRMKSYTDQIAEVADKTAASFATGFGGALGGGSATLNAMEALGHANGLVTTSGHRPGDPGFHGVNRARDLSNGSGQTPEMDKVANIMASQFGSSLTELIYTPMGFSIKNGQKTGLISPSNHYHHIHVAVAEGLAKAAVFSSEKAALNYERSMMPAGSEPMKVNLASMTANSSEFGGGGNITVGDVNVVVNGADNPREIANEVAEEILQAIKQTSYTEIFSS